MAKKLSAYNRFMKRELKGKMKGKTKAQRKAIFKAAARKWKTGKRTTTTKKPSKKSSKSSSKSSSSRRSKMRSFLNWNSLKSWIQKIALIAPAAGVALNPNIRGVHEKIRYGLLTYTGFDLANPGKFRWDFLAQGYMPYIAAVGVTEGVSLLKRMIKGLR